MYDFGEVADGGINPADGDEASGGVSGFFLELDAGTVFGRISIFEFSGGDFEHFLVDRDAELANEDDAVLDHGNHRHRAAVFDDFPDGFSAVVESDGAAGHANQLAVIYCLTRNPRFHGGPPIERPGDKRTGTVQERRLPRSWTDGQPPLTRVAASVCR